MWIRRTNKMLHQITMKFILILGLANILEILGNEFHQTNVKGSECYDAYGRPQRCIPPFENAAYNLRIEATNTCGEEGDTHFCVQTQHSNKKSCDVCVAGSHGPEFLTDSHNPLQSTWWQSETMFDGVQHPNQVNLTLQLGKSYDITYIRIVFYSPRPESFAIYKRQVQNGTWVPYQYYSATCRDTYRLPDSLSIKKNEDEARALCTSEYSDISPLRDGNIAFSSLEGRPSAYNFDNSTELQNWVTATDIKVTLHRLNTFGDEVFGDPQVLRSYYYAIADIAVGARCKCNGHANKCIDSNGLNGMKTRVCECKHFTDGPDCERCLPYYNDAPWGRASSTSAHECKRCNCNGYSNKCYFDRHLYNLTKHGGHCQDCTRNRDGPNCERCKENYYMRDGGDCINCDCDPIGSRSLQCNTEGKCQCKPGVTGEKCDRCDENYYNFGQHGCQQCNCNPWGSHDNIPSCDSNTGECACKENVEGRHCRECKPGFFNLDYNNKFGCTPCFCYGHTSECQSATGYSIVSTSSNFNKHKEKWNAVTDRNDMADLKYSQFSQNIATTARRDGEDIYFSAPDRFLGDQRASYNRLLKFKLQLVGQIGPNPSPNDVILEGAGTKISLPIFAQNYLSPDSQIKEFSFRLHENPEYSWQPSQSSRGFMSILSNLTAIKIRATYSTRGEAYLDDVELQTAHRGAAGQPATWIEQCTCPIGYLGQFCESCAPGYRHSPALGGPFMPCIPCDCNKHAEICDSETGRCICQHNTAGDTCDQCARGYYGNALGGTTKDCKKCPCPEDGACMQIVDESVICLECPVGYFGSRCELCSDGYYGDPTGISGKKRICNQCDCNGNVDPNAVGNCNRTTGECLKCIYNTGGTSCDHCLPGHFGDPHGTPHGRCEECSCYPPGTELNEDGITVCDEVSGNCRCKANIIGKNCNECRNGFFNIASGNGCESCNCDPIGSFNSSCDRFSGQCYCKPGVTGLLCDKCVVNHYGFSDSGCKECNCDPSGSMGFQCDQFGQCPCNDNVEGQRCDRCKENKYDRHQGCVDCPDCYNLVQSAANEHRAKLLNLSTILQEIASKPTVINDGEFEYRLKSIQEEIDSLTTDAKAGSGGKNKTPKERLDEFEKSLKKIQGILEETNELHDDANRAIAKAEKNVTLTVDIIQKATTEITRTLDMLKNEGTIALKSAKEKSDQLGQQSGEIGKISQAARAKADEIIAETEKVKEIAQESLKTANEALTEASDAIKLLDTLTDDLTTNVNQDLMQQKNNLKETTKAVGEALEAANSAYDQTLTKSVDINGLTAPDINVDDLRKEIHDRMEEEQQTKNKFDQATELSEDVLLKFTDNIELAEVLVERAYQQKEVALSVLADTTKNYEAAKEAVLKGDNTLIEANNTYHKLSGFQNQVQQSSDEAEKSLQTVELIEDRIQKAKLLNVQAQNALIGAQNNANAAKETAQEAQVKYAEEASKEAETIQKKANDTKAEARKLRTEADQMAGRVAVTVERIERLEKKSREDEESAKDAKEKVGQAQADVNDAKNQVARAMSEVQGIVDELSNLQNINEHDLDELDKRLTKAEYDLEEANLSARLESLKELKNIQNTDINNYQKELEMLESEVDNIRLIADALPDGCFKNVRLEI